MSHPVTGTLEDVLKRYPYVPGTRPFDYPAGSIERIQGIEDEGFRAMLASYFLRNQRRWIEEETKARARQLQAQSRQYLDRKQEGAGEGVDR